MSNKPFASFCFSTYQRPGYLREALDGLLLQSFPDFEVIVSDNDSEQSGKEVVESFNDPRFKYFPNGENLGMNKSFNKSFERSSGEFIVMIADDDPVYPNMLKTLHGLWKENPGYGMYLGGCDWFCKSPALGKQYNFHVGTNSCLSDKHEVGFKRAYAPGEFLKQLFNFEVFPHYLWSTCMVKRGVLEKMGGIPQYGTPFLGDYAYLSAAGAHSGCVLINSALGCQTLHDENFGRNQDEQIAIAVRNFPQYLEQKASHLPEWPEIKERMERFTALWAVSHMSFLYGYYKKKNISRDKLNLAAKEIFNTGFAKKYRLKFYLKTRFPFLHNFFVRLKKNIREK